MDIFISGSLAYDRIMDFPGSFKDHILPDQIHVLNVCFNINGLIEKFGGTAGNIAYTLGLLGEKPNIVAAAGTDFARYEKRLRRLGLSDRWIRMVPEVLTAGAYITTDKNDNQITAFNPGAMAYEADLPPLNGAGEKGALILIGPGNKTDMANFAEKARKHGVPFIFDPGQSLNIWSGEEIAAAVKGAACFISNGYELSLFLQMTGWSMEDLYANVETVITTSGPDGSTLDMKGNKERFPAVPVEQVCDPTGAGDAYRAGLIKGRALGRNWGEACRLGSVTAAYAVEHYGTQEHAFTWEEFCTRYAESYGPLEA